MVNRTYTATLFAAAGLLLLTPADAAAQQLAAADREKIVQYLTSTREQVLGEAASLSDAQWSYKPGPNRWSVGEVVEHLALAEDFLRDVQQKIMTGPPATAAQLKESEGKDAVLLKTIPDRTSKVNAPEPLQPTTRLGSRAEVLAAFKDRRAKTIDYANTTTLDLRSRAASSPIGTLDGYQWLLFIGAHNERHLAQIREVKADAGFPKSNTQ